MRCSRPSQIAAVLISSLVLLNAFPSSASGFLWFEDDNTPAERISAIGVDIAFVRPVGFLRLAIGGIMVLPAALLASPGGKESVKETFDLFVVQPANYIFRRELGDF